MKEDISMTKNNAYIIFPFLDTDGRFVEDIYRPTDYKKMMIVVICIQHFIN